MSLLKTATLALLLGTLQGVAAAESGSWTNLAGHALNASPKAIQGKTVTFVLANGQTKEYPLLAFLPAEQERLRCVLKATTLPAGLQSAHDFAVRSIKRSRLMLENGLITEAAFQQTSKAAIAAFRMQADPLIAQKKLSKARLELIVCALAKS